MCRGCTWAKLHNFVFRTVVSTATAEGMVSVQGGLQWITRQQTTKRDGHVP